MNPVETLQLAAAQSIFETVKTSLEIDGCATVPLARLKRQIDFIQIKQDSTGKTLSLNQLFDRLQDNPVTFTAYGASYVAVILDNDSNTISRGRVKELERSKGKIIYRRNSRVIESRRPNNNWRSNENAKTALLETSKVTIMPFARWLDILNERTSQELADERQRRDDRLAKRYIGKSVRAKFKEEPTDKNLLPPDWMTLAKDNNDITNIPNDAILTIGFGIDTTTPLRLLSYPLLALELLREKPNISLEYYCATQFNTLFGISPENAMRTENITQKSLQAFIRTYFPDVSGRVRFLPTRPITKDQRAFLYETLVPILAKRREISEFANAINGTDSLYYIAAHSLYMRDPLPIDPSLYINPLPVDNRPIVMIGGDGERVMWDARQLIIKVLGGTLPIQLFTTLGRIPPYFRRENEPVVNETITQNFLLQCSPEVYRDYASLLVAIAKSYGDSNIRYDDVSVGLSQRSNFLSQDSISIALVLLNEFSTQTKGAI